MICAPGEIAIVPFPFSDMARAKPRPALALSTVSLNETSGATVFAMITTAARSYWATDVSIKDHQDAGLKSACVVRSKLFTLDNRLIGHRLGSLSEEDRAGVRGMLRALIAV